MIHQLAALSAATIVGYSAAQAAQVVLTPTADGDVQVFGGDSVQTGSEVISITQSGGLIRNGIYEYDLTSIADNATITKVTFEVTLNRFISNTADETAVDLFLYGGDGNVTIADFDAAAVQVFDGTTPTGGSKFDVRSFEFSETASLQDLLGGDLATLRFETDSFASIALLSIEEMEEGDRTPRLIVAFDVPTTAELPLPGALPLLISALGAGFFARQRRSTSS